MSELTEGPLYKTYVIPGISLVTQKQKLDNQGGETNQDALCEKEIFSVISKKRITFHPMP